MSIKFYEHPLSPYARKVKIVMHEKEIPFEALFVSPSAGIDDAAMREFARISPRLEVPCLADGPTAISDSTIMLDYLDEKYPDPPMLPASPEERARVRMLEEICDTEIEAVLWGLFEIRIFGRAQGEQAEAMAATAGSQLRRLWGRLERELSGRGLAAGEPRRIFPGPLSRAHGSRPRKLLRGPALMEWTAAGALASPSSTA